MTKIFKAMPFGSARGERQNRVKSVECLDCALLFDTEHCSVERWLQVQANDVGRLLFKLRVSAGHVPTHSMRLNTAQLFGKPIAAPMGRTISGTLPRGLQGTRLGLGCPRSALTTAITRIESGQTLFLESASSTPGYTRHCNPVAAELPGKNDPRLTSK